MKFVTILSIGWCRKTPHLSLLQRLYLLIIIGFSLCTSLFILNQSREPDLAGKNESLSTLRNRDERWLHADTGTRVRRLPNAIVIGTRKSGTRALLRFLEVNPNIKSALSEVHFFDRLENYNKGLEWYKKQMPKTAENEITIEKSPAYFVTRRVPERVKAMNASVKLIVIFRNPVTRLISDYSQLVANRLESEEDYDDARRASNQSDRLVSAMPKKDDLIWQNASLEFARHVLTPEGRVDESRRLVRTGMYSMHLERWLAVFPRSQFHFVDGEQLITKPHVELQKLEKFLGVTPTIRQEHFVYSKLKGFYCLTRTSLAYRSTTIEQNHQRLVVDKPICLSKSKGRRHVAVNDELKQKLADFYAPFNEYLSALTDISLN